MELHNRIKGQMAALSRSYGEFGWLLDNVEQEMIKESIQKAKNISAEDDDPVSLKDLLMQLENGAQKLSAAMFSAPESQTLHADGWPREEEFDSDAHAQQLMKSALNDAKLKK
jgi:hypothetical protein